MLGWLKCASRKNFQRGLETAVRYAEDQEVIIEISVFAEFV